MNESLDQCNTWVCTAPEGTAIEQSSELKLKSGAQLVGWPSPQDYNEAIQNPKFAFNENQLASYRPELNALGLPKPSCGNFASVYRLLSREGDFAVRCFLHPVTDQARRYEAIHEHTNNLRLPCLLEFNYIGEGIRVYQGNRYPIVTMEWASGVSLGKKK